MSLPSGTRLGRYEIVSQLGAGGMGEVYLAHDSDLDRSVAIKVLRAEAEESTDRVRRFIQEAKAASSLNHPNVAHVYEVGAQDDLRFIAMEMVEGANLRQRIAQGPISIGDVLSIGRQIAAALGAAHKVNIIHRDIKPENVMIRPDGYVKVVDFGLAKLRAAREHDAEPLVMTNAGVVVGTLRYMSPEQLSGDEVTPASDVFSVGVVLYEMLAGQHTFFGSSAQQIASAILTRDPRPLLEVRPDTPPALAAVIDRALAKLPKERYATANELSEELTRISHETSMQSFGQASGRTRTPAFSRRAFGVAATVVLALVVAIGIFAFKRSERRDRGFTALKSAEAFLKQERYADAFEAATMAASLLPGDVRSRQIAELTSVPIAVATVPAGADVYLQRFHGSPSRVKVGTTPFKGRVAATDYLITIEKNGFAPESRTLSLAPFSLPEMRMIPAEVPELSWTLVPAGAVPPEMVRVPGGPYRLTGWSRASDRGVQLREYLIDRFEVSNRDYAEFIRDGGYRRKEFWVEPFVEDGRTLTFEEAMARFHDLTSLPGPRHWSGGAPPQGHESDPVTHVTWYEAAAFARWKGKSLPTIYEWNRAARTHSTRPGTNMPWGQVVAGTDVTERANFTGKGPMRVDAMPFGASGVGALNMAGNVAEWLRNPKGAGYAVAGGSWQDPVYAFGRNAAFPAWYESDTVGFRCSKPMQPGDGDQGAFPLLAEEPGHVFHPVDDATYQRLLSRYDYEKAPLNAHVVERVQTPEWTREKIVFDVDGRSVPAYLYTPRGGRGPLQVVHFAAAGDVASGLRTLTASIENGVPAALVRGGRALFSVVLEGYAGRPSTRGAIDSRTEDYVDLVVDNVTELRRGFDYLETRKDLDASRVAFFGPSAGTWAGVVLTAVEPRYKSVIFVGTSLRATEESDAPAGNRVNFVPHITQPKLVLHGRYDELAPWLSTGEPLYRLLPEPKQLLMYEGPHVPPLEICVPAVTRFLDQTLGPVSQ